MKSYNRLAWPLPSRRQSVLNNLSRRSNTKKQLGTVCERDGNRICPQTERNGIKRDYAFINLDGGSRNCFNDLVALHTRENAWTLANYQENLAKQLRQAAGNLWRGKNLHETCNACRQMLGKLGKSVLDIRLFKVRLYCIILFSTSSAPVFIHKTFFQMEFDDTPE